MAGTQQVNLAQVSTATNVLHYFRSYNYLFTLSAVPLTAFNSAVSADQVAALADQYVIAKSAGKDESGIQLRDNGPPTWNVKSLVDTFNTSSPGRFNFYFDDVEINSIISFDKSTGFSKATKLSFNIIEPYSLAGLLEALQVTAVATGYPSYKSAPYILKLEFKGYPDWDTLKTSTAINVENSTRYFIIRFSEMAVQTDERGTRYSCKAIPMNELTFGDPNKLKTNISIEGNTVGAILENFAQALTSSSKETNKASSTPISTGDEYQILFPEVDPITGVVDYTTNSNAISSKQLGNLSVDDVPYSFVDPITHQDKKAEYKAQGNKTIVYNPAVISTQFTTNANIHDCISAIVRDSEYGTALLKDIESYRDQTDHVPYFTILAETSPIFNSWNPATNQFFHTYRFYVIPYKIHISKIPGRENDTIDMTKLRKTVRRRYDYLYTGKNLDVISFNLNFNHLYFQNQPLREGNQNLEGTGRIETTEQKVSLTGNVTAAVAAAGTGANLNPRQVDPRSVEVQYSGEQTRPAQANQYSIMVKNLHQAIIDNVGMSKLEIEILGDPVYLVQNGTGNLRVPGNPDHPGLTMTGDIDYQISPVYVEVTFKNPADINKTTGLLTSNTVASFSGVYMVTNVTSTFNNGVFKQRLSMLRMPGQPIDTGQSTVMTALNTSWSAPENETAYIPSDTSA